MNTPMTAPMPVEPGARVPMAVRDGGAPIATTATAASSSAVSWAAIIAGAVGAAALSLILLLLGTGLGFSSVSPWAGQGASAVAIGVSTIVWLTFTQLAASGVGGYLAGRLRTKWTLVHTDEVYFRDTAHGFLAWALATLVTAAFLTSAIGSIIDQGVETGTAVLGAAATTTAAGVGAAGAAASADEATSPNEGMGLGYFVDTLFRKDASAPSAAAPAASGAETASSASTAEVLRIFANDLQSGLTPEDTRYVGQLIAQRTGLSQQQAEKRVSDTFAAVQAKVKDAKNAAREAADKARKASAVGALWLFVSLLIGAFVASLAATYGGRRRDL